MPSAIIAYVAGSGFVPVLSGNPWIGWSGKIVSPVAIQQNQPIVGSILYRADPNNSGNMYLSLSGAWVFSGQVGCLPGSGGPTITSGGWLPLSGCVGSGFGTMDAMIMRPGDVYQTPKLFIHTSGPLQHCFGTDTACSGGFARVYWELA